MNAAQGRAKELRKKAKTFLSFRQHPVKIIKYTTKYLWLLLFSLGKYLIAMEFDIAGWLHANWFDIMIVVVIFIFAFVRWVTVYFELAQDRIIGHTGFLGMARTVVYFEEIASFSVCQGPLAYVLHSCQVYIDTDAKCFQSADIRIDLTKSRAMEIYQLICKKSQAHPGFVFTTRKRQLLVFSLLFTSAVSGAIVLLTVLYQAYLITDAEFEKRLLNEMNNQIQNIENYSIGKYFLAAGALIGLVWIMSFTSNLLRHWDFTCRPGEEFLRIRSGKGSRRHHLLRRDHINYLDFTQSFFMRLFNICSVEVGCSGYGKRRKEISALIPITTLKDAAASARLLTPEYKMCNAQVKTNSANIVGYVIFPLIAAAIALAAGVATQYFFPERRNRIIFIEIMLALPFFWMAVVKAVAALNTSMGFKGSDVTLCYCKWYTFHKVLLKKEKITKVTVRQDPFSKIAGNGTVFFYTTGERSPRHKVAGVNYKRALEILKNNGFEVTAPGDSKDIQQGDEI